MKIWTEDELKRLRRAARRLGVSLKSEAKKYIEVRVSPRLIRRREA